MLNTRFNVVISCFDDRRAFYRSDREQSERISIHFHLYSYIYIYIGTYNGNRIDMSALARHVDLNDCLNYSYSNIGHTNKQKNPFAVNNLTKIDLWWDTFARVVGCTYRAAPFWRITFPLCKWPCDGKPRSRRKSNASSTCRPSRWICDIGKHVDFLVYFRVHGSFHCDWFDFRQANKNMGVKMNIIRSTKHTRPTSNSIISIASYSLCKSNPLGFREHWTASQGMRNAVDSK